MAWWLSPSPPAPTPPPSSSAPDPEAALLESCVQARAPATLIATASSQPLHVRLVGRDGDRLEVLLGAPTLDREAFGPLAAVILVLMRGDRAHVLSGRVDGVPRRQGRGLVLGISCRQGMIATEARRSYRVPVPAALGLRASLEDSRGQRFVLQPLNLSAEGLGGLLPEAPPRSLAPGTRLLLRLWHAELPHELRVPAEVRMRSLASADREARCGLAFVLDGLPEAPALRTQLLALVARCESALSLEAVA